MLNKIKMLDKTRLQKNAILRFFCDFYQLQVITKRKMNYKEIPFVMILAVLLLYVKVASEIYRKMKMKNSSNLILLVLVFAIYIDNFPCDHQ